MNILAVRFESFPYGSAPSFRTTQLLKLAALCGNSITVISKSVNADDVFYKTWDYFRSEIRCISVEESHSTYAKILESCLAEERYDVVISPTSIRHFCDINSAAHKYGVPHIYDSVEWYDATNWRLQYLDFRYYEFQYLWRNAFGKADGIIAISRLIQEYFVKKNSNVVRIPTITDCKETVYRTKIDSSLVRFVFAGQLDRGKDNIDTFIQAMHIVDPNGECFQLDIYGPNRVDVVKHLGKYAHILDTDKNIIIHGRVPQQEAQTACFNSDFSVFFRLNRRSANAGFPTKLGECMTFGTPAICNDTGDISLVVKNKVNGYLLKTKSVDEIVDVMRHILTLSAGEREQMRREARKSAEEFFDYRNYREEMQRVLENAVKGRK